MKNPGKIKCPLALVRTSQFAALLKPTGTDSTVRMLLVNGETIAAASFETFDMAVAYYNSAVEALNVVDVDIDDI